MESIEAFRFEIDRLLSGEGAHVGFDDAVANFPEELRGVRQEGSPHSAWDLMEHMRIAQWDMVEFCRNPKHVSPRWPQGYWPESSTAPTAAQWDHSVQTFRGELEQMRKMVADPTLTLDEPFAWGDGQSVLREALQLADHNAYHVGELVFLRRLLGCWKK